MNKIVSASLAEKGKRNPNRGKYSSYTAERARIGGYAAENGPDRHLSKIWDRTVPETTARRLKQEYLARQQHILVSRRLDPLLASIFLL